MRVKWLRIVILLLWIFAGLGGMGELVYADNVWEQSGLFRVKYGYVTADGHFLSAYNYHQGFNFDYLVDISGQWNNDYTEIIYDFVKDPGQPMQWELLWDSKYFTFERGQELKINLPMSGITFNRGRINGFKVQALDDNLLFFAGQETYIPVQYSTTYQTTNKFRLFDTPSAGDILEFSEVVTVNGEVMTRGQDYQINYLRGELEFLIPLDTGTDIQVKYLYIVTNEELSDVEGKQIKGLILTKDWMENNLTGYYFRKGQGTHQVGGLAGRYSDRYLTATGEFAISKTEENTQAISYDINLEYKTEKMSVQYQTREIEPEFIEIGINKYPKGGMQKFTFMQRAEEDVELTLELESFKNHNNDELIQNTKFTGQIEYEFLPEQYCQFIFQKNDDQVNGIKKSEEDVALGYVYAGESFQVTLGQFIFNADTRFLKIKLMNDIFRFNTDYKIRSEWSGKKHDLKIDYLFKPVNSLKLNGLIFYERSFVEPIGKYRVLVNGTWLPNNNWIVKGGYVTFNHPGTQGTNHRYTMMVDYNTIPFGVNLNFVNNNRENKMILTDEYDLTINSKWKILTNYSLIYAQIWSDFNEYSKYHQRDLQHDKELTQNLSLNYQIAPNWDTYLTIGLKSDYLKYWDVVSEDHVFTRGIGFSYRQDQEHLIKMDTEFITDYLDKIVFTGNVVYPFCQFKINTQGKLTYYLNLRNISDYSFKTDLQFPQLYNITPQIQISVEAKNQFPLTQDRKLDYGGALRYQFTEKQSIFAECKFTDYSNTLSPDKAYKGTEIFTGIEFNF